MSEINKIDEIVTKLYQWCTTYKDQAVIKDTTRLKNTKFDAFIDSNLTTPLSFTLFELSNSGELIIDSQQRILESQAAFFLFVNPKTGWIFSIKNTLEDQKKLLTNQPIQNFSKIAFCTKFYVNFLHICKLHKVCKKSDFVTHFIPTL